MTHATDSLPSGQDPEALAAARLALAHRALDLCVGLGVVDPHLAIDRLSYAETLERLRAACEAELRRLDGTRT